MTSASTRADFWAAQRVFLTGHTGFKGAWTSLWLERLGAEVLGYALPPDQHPDLYSDLAPFERATSMLSDVGDLNALRSAIAGFDPTLILHMAAQPLVRKSYSDPIETFATNVMGTANLLEAARHASSLRAMLVVTTDKVYRNDGFRRKFIEGDQLGGHDPYSASKACAELVTSSYAKSFFKDCNLPVATARAGNVIGGGDWSTDRIVPDVWRAYRAGEPVELRYPDATRPWQHVLDSINGYLLYLEALAAGRDVPRALNFGPDPDAAEVTVSELVHSLLTALNGSAGWRAADGDHPPEMPTLSLDARAATHALQWRPRLHAAETVRWTADWYKSYETNTDVRALTNTQIDAYEALR